MRLVPSRALQTDSLDQDARTALWNLFHEAFFRPALERSAYLEDPQFTMLSALWAKVFRRGLDTMPEDVRTARQAFFAQLHDFDWYRILDFAEECARIYPPYRDHLNRMLESENIAFRLVGQHIEPITDPAEIAEIEEARRRTSTPALDGARRHIDSALEKLALKPQPDVFNAIKEAICAVEVVARKIAGEGNTLGNALKKLDVEMNPSLKQGLEKIYGWTNGPDGIRHAMMAEPNVALEDARFMVIACSAFVNYLIVKADRRGIKF